MYYPTDDQKIQALDSLITSGEKEGYTVGEYFHELLKKLWIEGEGFSGKRPFGNSGWQRDVMISLLTCRYIPGHISYYDDGDIEDMNFDTEQADRLIIELIQFIFSSYKNVSTPD